MPRYAHPDFLDNGLNELRNDCNSMVLISDYTVGDSYAVVTGRILAQVAMAPADFTLGSSGNDRTLTTAAGKQDPSANASGGSATNHIAFLDTVGSRVLWVTPETSGQSVTATNPVNFPSLVYTARQPVAPA
jgi:hypothetical protein